MEFAICFIVWISAAIFSLLNVYQFGRNVDKSELFASDFESGWSIIGRSKDVSDYEWSSWKAVSIYLLPWICIHAIVSEFLRNKITHLKLWYCLLPIVFILVKLGLYAFALLLLQPIIYWIVLKYNLKIKWVWLLSSVFLILFNGMKYQYENDNDYYLKVLRMTENEFYMMSVAVFWIQLRCISYCLEMFEFREKCSFLNMLCYCIYLPLLFLGPVILYNDFYSSLQSNPKLSFNERLYNLFLNVGRYLCWYIFLEFSLHFIYFNALQYNIDVVNIMPDWCLYGGGLWMGLYFYLKYLVTYGIAGSMAALDNIVPETPPLCIARVHLYSQMWKYFDVGLHKFLIR